MYYFIYSAQPIACVIALLMFLKFLNTETPKFYLMNGQYDEARDVIRRIYITEGQELKTENIMKFYQVTNNQENKKVSMGEALFTDDKYTRSSWVCIIAMCF